MKTLWLFVKVQTPITLSCVSLPKSAPGVGGWVEFCSKIAR